MAGLLYLSGSMPMAWFWWRTLGGARSAAELADDALRLLLWPPGEVCAGEGTGGCDPRGHVATRDQLRAIDDGQRASWKR